ncbi:hypothetical protein Tco_0891320 [Tanacetum coccineum]|uniref:Uncharacterized protein n=1 Tax=Tanacetum coccineum TaxID=301880 RepID=A0ABQ5C447_9ASTR
MSNERQKLELFYFSLFQRSHGLTFHHLDDAKDIWLAVKARFGGNEESKKMRKSMLKQEFADFKIFESEGLHKGYDGCRSSNYNLRVHAAPTHSAFTSDASTNSKWSNADSKCQPSSVSYTTTSSSADASGNVLENVLHSFVAESDPQQQITYEDFDQIGKLDLEELDIKWQMAMLSVRINRFEKRLVGKFKFLTKMLPGLIKEGQVAINVRVGTFCKRMYREEGGIQYNVFLVHFWSFKSV